MHMIGLNTIGFHRNCINSLITIEEMVMVINISVKIQ